MRIFHGDAVLQIIELSDRVSLAYNDPQRLPEPSSLGGKALGLLRLDTERFPIPRTLIVPAHLLVDASGADLVILHRWVSENSQGRTILRSSASQEDHPKSSRAGYYRSTTIPSNPSVDALRRALLLIVNHLPHSSDAIRESESAVIIQPYINAQWRGTLFTQTKAASACLVEVFKPKQDIPSATYSIASRFDGGDQVLAYSVIGDDALSATQLRMLAVLSKRLDGLFAVGTDAEFVANRTITVVQARSITRAPHLIEGLEL